MAIRPHGMFGPREAHYMPSLLAAAKADTTKYQVGAGQYAEMLCCRTLMLMSMAV